MKDGFIKCGAASIDVTVADTKYNTEQIKRAIDKAENDRLNLLVLPELCVTGYPCGDLFFSETLLGSAKQSLSEIAEYTADKYPVVIVGAPIMYDSKLYNCAAVIHSGQILGLVPKVNIPNYSEFYEKRQFSSAFDLPIGYNDVTIGEDIVPISEKLIFKNSNMENFRIGVEICEDIWASNPPSTALCESGATVIANPSASNEVIGKQAYRRLLINSASGRLICGYVYSNASYTESTQDVVFSKHNIIAENGTIIAENVPFGENDYIVSEFDVNRLVGERHRITSFNACRHKDYTDIYFDQPLKDTVLTRKIDKNPFVPPNDALVSERAQAILKMQSYGLKKRIEHSRANTAVIGISGGLDSSLALLVTVRTMDLLKRSRKDILAVTMPCFGTTKRTKSNAQKLCELLGVSFKEVDITDAVKQHFKDIGQDTSVPDVTFENSQARERTQVLMDIANKTNGIVIGTGDLSESALGWATYNGDHMSMYGVNSSVPKTLVRYIVRYEAENSGKELSEVLFDILDTPVSPELLPVGKNGEIAQKTEDFVGPYELHDFFLYYMLRFGFPPSKIFRLAKYAFNNEYSDEVILKWLKVFVRRFFTQQFKRSCMPDSVKVGSATLSPRGDWRMPSDASYRLWMDELENL